MRKRKLSFEEMVQRNKEELLRDQETLAKIEAKMVAKQEKIAENN